MLKFLEKLISQKDEIHRECGALLRYTQDCQKQLSIVRKVLVQEKEMFEFRKVSDCIVSIDRHYIRPIVRGKETKSAEFGAKVNNIQIDGRFFIEHILCKAFNEGILSERQDMTLWKKSDFITTHLLILCYLLLIYSCFSIRLLASMQAPIIPALSLNFESMIAESWLTKFREYFLMAVFIGWAI